MPTPLNGTLVKGFDVLALFGPQCREITAAMVVDDLGMNSATAHRFLQTLLHVGALRQAGRGRYRLGRLVEELGWLAERDGAVAAAVQPIIAALCRELGESVMVGRAVDGALQCVAVSAAERAISVRIEVGTRLPLSPTAQGKLWLSEMTAAERGSLGIEVSDAALAEVREQGFARNQGDNEPDIGAIAVPVRDASGRLQLSLSVFGMLSRIDPPFVERARPALLQAAGEMAELLRPAGGGCEV